MAISSDSYGQRHLVRGNANKSSDNRTARNITISNFEDIAKNVVVVEVVPNTKQAPLAGLKGKKRQAQKRKSQVSNYYRLMVPVRIGDRIKTLVVVAEEHDGVVSTGSVPVTAYEIYYAKKPPLAATPRPKTGVSAAEEETPLIISIRDMLTGVKDADGNVYAQSAWHGSPYDFREFLLEMIGAGEGRQAHGWGLYFAQNREVSERYKEWLKKAKKKAIHTLTYDSKSLNEQPPDVQRALRGFENYYLDLLRGKSAADVLRMMRDEHIRDKEMHEKKRAEFDVPLTLYEENPKISVRALLNSVGKYSFLPNEFHTEGFKNVALAYLGKSLMLLADADVAVFVQGYAEVRGCRIEHEAAVAYGVERVYV